MSNPMEKHVPFIEGELLPLVVQHAKDTGSPSNDVVLLSLLSLGIILLSEGFSHESLCSVLFDSANATHGAPEGLQ